MPHLRKRLPHPPEAQPPSGHGASAPSAPSAAARGATRLRAVVFARVRSLLARAEDAWIAPWALAWRGRVARWRATPPSGIEVVLGGTALVTLFVVAVGRAVVPLANPGLVYLPFVAMVSYHWGWRYGAWSALLAVLCTYLFFIYPVARIKPLTTASAEQLATLAAVTTFILALVQLAASRRAAAERAAARLAAINAVGRALASELNEERLLRTIAATARSLTGATFAAFTLRPVDAAGQPLVPAEGNRFHLAAVVGVTAEQEALFRRMPLGGEGVLAPIFRNGTPVRVDDVLAMEQAASRGAEGSAPAPGHPGAVPLGASRRAHARAQAAAYAHGQIASDALESVGIPRGHPIVRSFLGVPLLDRAGQVRGGLLLGHNQPGRFSDDDEALLLGLAAQAAVALENARLFHAAHMQAQELDAVFESISEAITLVDAQGQPLRENGAARQLRQALARAQGGAGFRAAVAGPLRQALAGATGTATPISLSDADGESREYLISAAPLRPPPDDSGALPPTGADTSPSEGSPPRMSGAVVVTRDITEERRLLAERQARLDAEARRALLQLVIGELPSGVYLVRGMDARLSLINPAATEAWGARWREGQPMADFLHGAGIRVLSPEGRELPRDQLATVRTLRDGASIRHYQEVIRRPDGTSLPVLLNAVALASRLLFATIGVRGAPAGEPGDEPAALVVLQDVTALKEAERLKDEFIAIAAHELKTPMAAVKGYAQTLLLRSGPPTTGPEESATLAPWQREALATIDAATTRLVELTDDLLDVSRLAAGHLELHREPHDLVALARRVARRAQVAAPDHVISVVAPADYVVAELDVRRTEQILGNLLSNAVKYSPAGSEVSVRVTADGAAGTGCVSVSDPGIGIPADQQTQMFGRFVRAENARAAGIPGTGLGLYLSRELVERQGGRIWFESAPGQRTTFSVTLPLTRM